MKERDGISPPSKKDLLPVKAPDYALDKRFNTAAEGLAKDLKLDQRSIKGAFEDNKGALVHHFRKNTQLIEAAASTSRFASYNAAVLALSVLGVLTATAGTVAYEVVGTLFALSALAQLATSGTMGLTHMIKGIYGSRIKNKIKKHEKSLPAPLQGKDNSIKPKEQ